MPVPRTGADVEKKRKVVLNRVTRGVPRVTQRLTLPQAVAAKRGSFVRTAAPSAGRPAGAFQRAGR